SPLQGAGAGVDERQHVARQALAARLRQRREIDGAVADDGAQPRLAVASVGDQSHPDAPLVLARLWRPPPYATGKRSPGGYSHPPRRSAPAPPEGEAWRAPAPSGERPWAPGTRPVARVAEN